MNLVSEISYSIFQYFNKEGNGGIIEMSDKNIVISCSSFSDSSVTSGGGAISLTNCNINISKVSIQRCTAKSFGNAVLMLNGDSFINDFSLYKNSYTKENSGDSSLRLNSILLCMTNYNTTS